MKHLEHAAPQKTYNIALLIKESTFKQDLIEAKYINPLSTMGIQPEEIISFSLKYNNKGKAPAKMIKSYLSNLLIGLNKKKVKTLLVADAAYFKVLTNVRKVEPHHGAVLPCAIANFEHMKVILSVNYGALFYNPKLQDRLDMSLTTLQNYVKGFHIRLGTGIIHSAEYPRTAKDIQSALIKLYEYDELTFDIETFGLRIESAGLGTASFAWDQHNGIAFPIDYGSTESKRIRECLKFFLTHFKGKLTYHGSTFDIKVLIYNLWMDHPLDYEGTLEGLEVLFRRMDDTKIITYLAVNSTTRNQLSLKQVAYEFAGNWAEEEIKDITKIPLPQLLEYNLKDALATWYTKKKYYPIMVQDQQEKLYKEIFRPSLKVITNMELVGMPLNGETVRKVYIKLDQILWDKENLLRHSPIIIDFEDRMREEARAKRNAELKKKVKPLNDFVHVAYNPASPTQTAKLLYDYFGFDIIDTTDTGLPATGGKTIKKLLNKLKQDFNITDEELE